MLDNLFRPTAEEVLSVGDLTRQIKRQLEGRFTRFWVQGEVSNVRRQSSGHVYFSLKDAKSQLPAVCFARDAAQQSVQISDGMELILFGDLSVYEPHGRYQMIVKVAIQSGLGNLQIEYERLKCKLAAEGLFDTERKRRLPEFPKRIAVVTSPSGAAIQDFLRILKRRNFLGEVVIYPARVQGKEAAAEIKAMLDRANQSGDFDLIVLTRGGGSIEDLWPFNEEVLARAVSESSLPVISAVGHEIDHVLTDYAADLRAETPSGAAELISSAYMKCLQRLVTTQENLSSHVQSWLYEFQITLRDKTSRLKLSDPTRQLQMLSMRIDEAEAKLQRTVENRIRTGADKAQSLANRIASLHPKDLLRLNHSTASDLSRRMQSAAVHGLERNQKSLTYLEKRLENTSLQSSLKRGYAVLKQSNGSIILDAKQVAIDESIFAQLSENTLTLKVTQKNAD